MTPRDPETRNEARISRRFVILAGVMALVAALAAFGIAALLVNIFERQQEARNPFMRVVEIDENTTDPAVWGKNFPLQYDLYRRTVDHKRTRHGGSDAIPQDPTPEDPRQTVPFSLVQEDPRLRTMWAGYAFAIDYREARGHAYMLMDQTFTQRLTKPQYGNCLHCHASTYVPYREAGNGDIIAGFEKFNQMPYMEAKEAMEDVLADIGEGPLHPVACIDCHDPQTMAPRVTRPGFLEGIRAYKLATEGIENYDPNTMATRQEMRSFVCGQCHVEYYFRTGDRRLVYPWPQGLRADEVMEYYDEIGFSDWQHEITGANMLKAQHPEFELWNQGIHARAGVACADCHMPYVRVGAMKVSDHWVRSPLLNISNACQTCHRVEESELLARAERIQDITFDLINMSMDALMELIEELRLAIEAGASEEQLAQARQAQRHAQFLIDYLYSENSMGFHASQESARLMALALNYIREGQNALRDQLSPGPLVGVQAPDVSGLYQTQGNEQQQLPAIAPEATPPLGENPG